MTVGSRAWPSALPSCVIKELDGGGGLCQTELQCFLLQSPLLLLLEAEVDSCLVWLKHWFSECGVVPGPAAGSTSSQSVVWSQDQQRERIRNAGSRAPSRPPESEAGDV